MDTTDRAQGSGAFIETAKKPTRHWWEITKRIGTSLFLSVALYGAPLLSPSWQIALLAGCALAFALGLALGTWWWPIVAATPALLIAVVMLVLLVGEEDEGGWGEAIWHGGLIVAGCALVLGWLGVFIAKSRHLGLFKSPGTGNTLQSPGSSASPV